MNKILERLGWCWHKWPRWSEPFQGTWVKPDGNTKETMSQRRKCLKCDAVVYRSCS